MDAQMRHDLASHVASVYPARCIAFHVKEYKYVPAKLEHQPPLGVMFRCSDQVT